MRESDSSYLHRQADLCIALSRSTFDLTLAARLRAFAEDLRARADHADDQIGGFPPHAYRGDFRASEKKRN
jgi:hypothetical protein